MRAPSRPLPEYVVRWSTWVSLLRWLDALAGWAFTSVLVYALAPEIPQATAVSVGLVLLGLGSFTPPLRVRWRPISACVGISASASLRPGDRAWYIRRGDADLVVITARRGWRLVIATPAHGGAEGISVRRTRVLLVPAEVR
jgi:hypothetical protein